MNMGPDVVGALPPEACSGGRGSRAGEKEHNREGFRKRPLNDAILDDRLVVLVQQDLSGQQVVKEGAVLGNSAQ